MGAAHPLATKSIQPKYTHLRDKGLPSKTKTWSATTIKEMVYSQKSHESLFTLTPNEIAGLCRTIKEYGTANDPLNRKRLRAFVRQQLLLRQRQLKDPNRKVAKLTVHAIKIIQQTPGSETLPTAAWWSGFEEANKDKIHAGQRAVKSIARIATYSAIVLKEDFDLMAEQLHKAKLIDENNNWIATERDKSNITRINGNDVRSKLFQVDEKGNFIHYDTEKGKVKQTKYYAGKSCPIIASALENRECFSYVPWCDANGTVLFAQIIFKGAGLKEDYFCQGTQTAPIIIQNTPCGTQTSASFAEAIRHLKLRLIELHNNDDFICNQGKRIITTDGQAARYSEEVREVHCARFGYLISPCYFA